MTTERLQFEIQGNTRVLERIEQSVRRIEQAVNRMAPRATKQLQSFNAAAERTSQTQQRAAQATRTASQAQRTATQSTRQGKTALDLYNTANQDLVKSVQLALGPLSGVAARLTALGALFNKNAAAIAALIATMVGFTAAVRQAIAAGTNLERQMLALDAVIEATGRSAETSADQLNQLALRLGEDTLGSAVDFRNSLAQLSTFTNIATDDFEELTQVASGMSEIMGGNMVSNIRRLGRLFDDIENNLSSLSRAGINFTEAEEQKLVQLERSGNVAEAHAMILERLAAFSDLATKQSQGLAGQMDTMRERFRAVLEQSAATSSMIDGLTDVMQRVNDAVQNFLDNEEAVERLGNAFNTMARLVSNSLLFLVENAGTLTRVLSVLLTGAVIRRLIPAFTGLIATITNTNGRLTAYNRLLRITAANQTRAAAAAQLFGRSLLAFAGPIGAFAAAIGIVHVSTQALSGAYDEAETNARRLREVEEGLADTKDRLTNSIDSVSQALGEEERARLSNVQTALQTESQRIELEQRRLARQRESLSVNDDEIRDSRQLATEQARITREIQELEREKGNLIESAQEYNDWLLENIEESQNLSRVTRGLENSIFRLRQEYDQAGLDAAQHQRDIQAVEAQYERFRGVMHDLERDELQRLAVALGASGATAEEVDQAFQGLVEAVRAGADETDRANGAIDRMVDRFKSLRDEITQTRAALAGDPLGFDMADFRQLQEFDNQQLLQIADRVGVFIQNEGNAARELATALRDRQDFSEVLQELQQMDQARQPEGETIRAEFQRRRDLINQQMSLELDERLRLLELNHQAEIDKMSEFADSKIDLDFEANEASHAAVENQIEEHFRRQREIIEQELDLQGQVRIEKLREIQDAEAEAMREHQKTRQDIINRAMGENLQIIENFRDMSRVFATSWDGSLAAISIGLETTANLAQGSLQEQSKTFQRFAKAQAIIAGALAVSQVWADPELSTMAKFAVSGLVGAQVGAQIAKIKNQDFADGGMVRGPGTSRSDSIPANLSDGEFVMRAEAVRRIGANNLERMNEGNVPNFARGGAVGNASGSPTINIISEGGNQVEMEEGVGPNGEPEITARIKDANRQNMRRGRHDRDMRSNFGVKRQPIRR